MNYKIAIDGPAGSGKSTIAKIIAKNNNLIFFSTGFLFRAYALIITKNNLIYAPEDEIIKHLKNKNINTDNGKLIIDNSDYTIESKTKEISQLASFIATKRFIRNLYNEQIHKLIKDMDVVLEGRDIGTIILPNANFKFFLTASVFQRAKRRFKELEQLNKKTNIFLIALSIFKRDWVDKHRKVAPLKKAKDAIVINTSNKTIDEVVEEIQSHINKK